VTIGIIGRKRGMTRIYTEEGASVPVTVIEAIPNRVTGLISESGRGYRAVQVAWGSRRKNRITKPISGQLSRAGIETAEGLQEFRLEDGEGDDLTPGTEIRVDIFEDGQKVDVTGTTIGKGYAGVIKRHNFSSQRMSHGNSVSHRAPGSTGQCQTPGRVLKGKRMAGHMGNAQRTTQNLEVVKVDNERNLLLIKGSVPGSKGGQILVKPAIKTRKQD